MKLIRIYNMEILYSVWLWPVIFLLSLLVIFYEKRKAKSQCVISLSVIMIIFYCVCFLSGVCSILNFIFKWLI